MKQKKKTNKKPRKKGLWFNETLDIDLFASAKAEKIQKSIENVIFYGITIPLQLVQTVGVFVIAFYNDSFMALSFFLVGFFFSRSMLGETFHLNSTISCSTITWTMFFCITFFIPSIYVSALLSLILGCVLAIVMNYMIVRDEEKCQKE